MWGKSFDRYSSALRAGKVKAHQSSTESSEEDTGYFQFDPYTGELCTRKPSDEPIVVDMKHQGSVSFFGGVCSSALTDARSRGYTSKEFEDRVKLASSLDFGGASLHRFYEIQSLQMLGKEDDRVVVPIWIARDPNLPRHMNVAPDWVEHLQKAIKDINNAAPGLFLYSTTNPLKAKIKIARNNHNSSCFTRGNILETTWTEIFLYSEWSEMKRTSCHELLHAVGFQHEHQRRDRESSIHQNRQGSPNNQYKVVADVLGITRFDPFSILLYSEDEKLSRNRGDPVWITKPYKSLNREMSELDKVALNNVYHPCEGPNYSPEIFGRSVTGLKYCGR